MESAFFTSQLQSQTRFGTPLRYPGGKAKLTKWFQQLIDFNNINNCHYIELYAGGAGAAIKLLLNGNVKTITINDSDPVIYAFWWSVLNKTEELVKLIENIEITPDSWYQQKHIMINHEDFSLLEKGFSAFFLNRTNRSGILKGGMIGGKNQLGNYKLDARFNKIDLIQRIRSIEKFKNNIHIFNEDAINMFDWIDSCNPKETLVYLDPPYYNKGSQLYRNFYTYKDHENIASLVKTIKTPCVVTYDNCYEIRELYEELDSETFNIRYSAHMDRPNATELLFYKNLALHDIPLKR
ncbi:DNA adenine methylase [Acinetobacter venetianus]|uniref:DNA adenine methylase n=1 Tax=Acinetobacter venetianus TaxID=52133 RepID=UPI00384C94B4